MKSALGLSGGPASFAFLRRQHATLPGVDDAAAFGVLARCLSAVGVPPAEQEALWKILAAILHLGNIAFTRSGGAGGSPGGGGGGAEINADAARVLESGESGAALAAAAGLLASRPDALATALTRRSIVVKGEESQTLATILDAGTARDSLAKTLYSRAFAHCLRRINAAVGQSSVSGGGGGGEHAPAPPAAQEGRATPSSATATPPPPHGSPLSAPAAPPPPAATDALLPSSSSSSSSSSTALSLSILDIFGLEDLSAGTGTMGAVGASAASLGGGVNALPTLLINYANEELHALSLGVLIERLQTLYASEGVPWEPVPVVDNAPVLSL
jgi:myosin heavy subunit